MKSSKKYRLRKKYKLIVITVFMYFFISICIKPSGNISNLVNLYAKNHVKSTYLFKTSIGFKNSNNVKNDIFTVKEEKTSDPVIYLYNTHDEEKYQKSESVLYEPNVKIATKHLKEKIEESNLKTMVEERSIRDVLSFNGWNYYSSYKVSRMYLEDTFKTYPTIKYFFDIHRDSGSHDRTTICINNICYAKVLFLIGLENENYRFNQKFAEDLSIRINNVVDGVSKGVIGKKGAGVNGVYNQDFSSNLLLIEIGGENNTIEEVYNTINILSEIISAYIKENI